MREIKHKNVFGFYLFSILTFGIYSLVWLVKSKRDMNSLGAEIPTTWLAIIPGVNFYWAFKYCQGFSEQIKKDNNTMLWFCIHIFAGFLTPYFVQTELNKFAEKQEGKQSLLKEAA